MNSYDIFELIERIAATSSKNEKQALIAQHKDSYDFSLVLTMALDPLVTYGMKQLPERGSDTPDGAMFDLRTWALLGRLRERSLTGSAAWQEVQQEMDSLNAQSAELLKRIIRKDLRAGFSAETVNKAIPGLIKDFPYMRCSLPAKSNMAKWDWSEGIISQEKADGMFANVDHEEGGLVRITSRQGSPFNIDALEDLADDIRRRLKSGTQTHGELLVSENDQLLPREKGNGILNSLLKGGALEAEQRVDFFAWDQVPLAEVKPKGKYKTPYKERLRSLLEQVRPGSGDPMAQWVHVVPTRIVFSQADAFAHYREFLARGKEGTILKHPEAIWADNTSKDCVKLKLEVPVELQVFDFVEGNGKYQGTLGALRCESACGLLKVDVNGRTDAMRNEVWANREQWRGAIITVKANSIMTPSKDGDPHSLFLPVFLERRLDKGTADTLGQIQAQFEAAVAA